MLRPDAMLLDPEEVWLLGQASDGAVTLSRADDSDEEVERFDRLCGKATGLSKRKLITFFYNGFWPDESGKGKYTQMQIRGLTAEGAAELRRHT